MNSYTIKTNEENEYYSEITLKQGIYSKEAIFATAYIFIEKAFFILDYNKNDEIIINIELKNNKENKNELENVVKEFLNEIINYENYLIQSKESKEIRETILKRALLTNFIDEEKQKDDTEEDLDKILENLE